MLIYHPAFDSYHCLFRLIFIISNIENNIIEIDKLKIIDFYLVFPKALANTRFPIECNSLKQKLQLIKEDYRNPVDARISFKNMQEIQTAALNLILSLGYIKLNDYKQGLIVQTDKYFPNDLADRIKEFNIYEDKILPKEIIKFFINQPLNGSNGIKDRTKIMEYRYVHA